MFSSTKISMCTKILLAFLLIPSFITIVVNAQEISPELEVALKKMGISSEEKTDYKIYNQVYGNGSEYNFLQNFAVNGVAGGSDKRSSSINTLYTTNDTLLLGGNFEVAGNKNANFIAGISNGKWLNFGEGVNNGTSFEVYAITKYKNSIIVGGSFINAGGKKVNGIAKWEGNEWKTLGDGNTIGVYFQENNSMFPGYVTSLLVVGDTLYVGGAFNTAGGVATNAVAGYNLKSNKWFSLSTRGIVSDDNLYPIVLSMAKYDEYIVFGGTFIEENTKLQNLVFYSPNSNAFDGLYGGANDIVRCLAAADSLLYVGGNFTMLGKDSVNANKVGKFTEGEFYSLGNGITMAIPDQDFLAEVYSLLPIENGLLVGGHFNRAGGMAVTSVAKYFQNEWSAPGFELSISAHSSTLPYIKSIAKMGEEYYLGGLVSEITNKSGLSSTAGVSCLLATDKDLSFGFVVSSESSDKANGLFDDHGINAIISYTQNDEKGVLVGGNFAYSGGTKLNGIAFLPDNSEQIMPLFSAEGIIGLQGRGTKEVHAFNKDEDMLYIGGLFEGMDNKSSFNVIALDSENKAHSMAGGVFSELGVFTLISDSIFVYAGGSIVGLNNITDSSNANGIARFNKKNNRWDDMKGGISFFGTPAIVKAMAFHKGELYVGGGGFTNAGDTVSHGIIKWDGESWRTVYINGAKGFAGKNEETAGAPWVLSLTDLGDSLLIGGLALNIGEGPTSSFVVLKNDSCYNFYGQFKGKDLNYIEDILVANEKVYVTGYFNSVNGISANNIAEYSNGEWTGMGAGLNHIGYTLAKNNNDLFVGGLFTIAGNSPSVSLAAIKNIFTVSNENYVTSPTTSVLLQNYPNPFNPSTTIKFTLQNPSFIRLTVYNAIGEKVKVLTAGYYDKGEYSVVFDGSNFASGLYFYQLVTDDLTISKKMLLIK